MRGWRRGSDGDGCGGIDELLHAIICGQEVKGYGSLIPYLSDILEG